MDFHTGLFRRPTKSWSTHQLNSIYTVASHRHLYDRYKIQTQRTIVMYICKLMRMRLNLRRNFRLCLQVDTSSLRLLSVAMSGLYKI